MDTFIHTLRYGWHPMRVLYLIFGIMLLVQAVQARDWTFGMLGGLFLYQSIFNAGCCGMSGVMRGSGREVRPGTLEETEYTEIK